MSSLWPRQYPSNLLISKSQIDISPLMQPKAINDRCSSYLSIVISS